MKLLKKYSVSFVFIAIVFYLSGCFMEATFNISIWDKGTRMGVASTGLIVWLISVLGISIEASNSKS